MHRERSANGTDHRSISPIVGLILLFGVVVAASALVFVYGTTTMDQVESQSDFEHAKLSAAQVDRCLSTVAATGDRGADCDISEYDVVDDGHLEVFVNDDPTCSMSAGLGSLTRDSDGTTIGYQAGGRFQRTERGSTVISDPDISYSTATIDGEETLLLDISLINVTGTADGTTVRRTGSDRDDFESCLGDQCVESMTMFVNDSTFHGAWVQFLEDEFGAANVTDHSASNSIEVTASLDRTRSTDEYFDAEPTIYGGVYSAKDLTLDNNVDLFVDTTTGARDWFVVDGDLDARPNAMIDADTVVTRSLQHGPGGPGNPPTVTGGVYYGVYDNWQGDVEATQVTDLASVDSIGPIDDDVETAHDRLEDAESVDGETVTAGAYTATHSSLGDVETIDTSDGDVHIGVTTDDWARLEDLSVTGDGQVHIYLDGGELEFTGTTGGSEADQVWVYGTRSTGLTVADEFSGVVYKPGGTGADVKLKDGVDVTGAIVAPVVFDGTGNGQQYSVTFDESLRTHTLLDLSNGNAAVDVTGDEIDASEFDRATLSVVDQQIAQDHVVENTSTVRQPLDVTFVMDRSGSMSMGSFDSGIFTNEWSEQWWNGLFEVHDREVLIRDEDGTVRSIEPGEDGWLYDGEEVRVSGGSPYTDITIHRGNDPHGQRVDAVQTFIDQMNESAGDRAGAVDFNLTATELHQLDGNFGDVTGSLEANANGGTNIAVGLEEALDEQDYRDEADANRVVILLSDGENDGYRDKDDLDDETLEQAELAADRNITIHTIGLGSNIDESLLTDIADETGGQYHHVDNADGLEDTFEAVGEGVTDEREHVIENKDVETEVSGSTPAGGQWDLDPTQTVSLQIDAYGCDGYDPTGSTVTNDSGTTFEYVDCEDRDDDNVTEVDKATSVHEYGVYTDGDTVPSAHYLGPDKGWWQDDFEDDLESEGLTHDGSFELEDGQAVVVVQFQGGSCGSDEACEEPFGYAIYLFEGSADDELEVNAPDARGTADDSSNTYVINIVETELEAGDG
ncbi:vWA domain-containing protein [Halomontanus rarus]|uniref:vWA domain-containing protein n=1 Tax=Halomontanus rarus TaxID=3034020 RepID=UPI0023E7DF3D|nr:vWA domain-containing protein [Halovivax sp. TS33]